MGQDYLKEAFDFFICLEYIIEFKMDICILSKSLAFFL